LSEKITVSHVNFVESFSLQCLGLSTHLFVMVPRPEDSEVTSFSVFEWSCHLLLPV